MTINMIVDMSANELANGFGRKRKLVEYFIYFALDYCIELQIYHYSTASWVLPYAAKPEA
jgi:hypothetical protein